ncbi:outer membrane efflux protein [Sphingomonas oleivorans]|uniref:Outer membrane efflux protein n=1 Tax=Sphingomonas oleivorans TaxID=1735121 RepID=A0A2T5G0N2_9SPHN|nr:TolC family protein [Sphingomonas oleivorans]PTQ12707.1 outer membrane efflux protein [Sphingomonas oleivorans]
MFRLSRAALIVAACLPSAAFAAPLTLQDAISRTLGAAPQAASAAARNDALVAARAAADTRPSASIDALAENLGVGGKDLNDQIQVGAVYSQRIERGGKRAARVALADGEIRVARAEAVVQRLEIAATVQRLFVEVEAAQVALGNARERVAIAEALAREVGRRVSAARDPLFAGTRAQTQLAEAKVDLELAIHAHDAALTRLIALWGGTPNGLQVATDNFLRFDRPVTEPRPSAPDLAVYEARAARADAAITLERARAVQDPTVSAGPRYLPGTGDVALVAGFSLPLGNRALNRANVARVEAERRQADADMAVERFERTRAIALAAEKVEESRHEAEAIRDRVIPGAERTLAEVRAGYARGGFSFLDVSAAQSALAAARSRLVQAATRYHEAGVELDRLTGRFADTVQETR